MKNRFLVISLVTLFLSGLVVASLNAQPLRGRRMIGHGQGAGAQILKDALQLTPEQEKKLEELRQARQEEAKAFQEKRAKLSEDFRKLMEDPKTDEKKVNSLIDEMAKLRADRMKTMFKHRKEWEKILTPEQLQKLEEYRKDARLKDHRSMSPRRRMATRGMMMRPKGLCPLYGR
ncbi:MAG: Spy/CpxP family protein refolding chaperone [Acidobacteriota bacterium]|nr:Spy/CpxP family protein refolding chaperone [Acidobacteriota bacterium]MDW3229515.1 Spy/CpxP family protein refolding chaperone [Acidobacteriota bacterium]